MSDINDLISLAIDKNPTEFAEKFNEILAEKVAVVLEERSVAVASSLYVEEDEFDFDDEDLDEDIDLDDLDISDLDDEFEDIDDDSEDA